MLPIWSILTISDILEAVIAFPLTGSVSRPSFMQLQRYSEPASPCSLASNATKMILLPYTLPISLIFEKMVASEIMDMAPEAFESAPG